MYRRLLKEDIKAVNYALMSYGIKKSGVFSTAITANRASLNHRHRYMRTDLIDFNCCTAVIGNANI
jgi:hypothetical protein